MEGFLQGVSKKKILISAIVLLLCAFLVGLYIGIFHAGFAERSSVFAGGDATQPEQVDFTPFWKAWNAINERYVPAATSSDIVSEEERVWGAIAGLARSLDDPYTVFLPPAENSTFEGDIRGNFEGVGMEIGLRGSVLTVIAPLKGTPAERAGILSGDRIIAIDEQPTDGMTVDEAVSVIRGERGTSVTFTIARKEVNELLEIAVVRDVIEIPTIDRELRSDGIFVISLYNFSAVSPALFQEALRSFIQSGSNKLILDLRGNPGGFLEAAIDMASWFLPTGKVIVTEDFAQNDKPRVHRSKGYNVFDERLEMVVLINQGSASASEILAGALSEHGVATLVGENTFGKGSVQELIKITSDTSLKVTIARWLTPLGNSISNGGLTPDLEIEMTAEDIEAGLDPQLDAAVAFLLGN